MSLEKSIKRLTEVIQARKPPSQVGPTPEPEIFGPPEPLPPLPPTPEDGWDCYWALKYMQEHTEKKESCCNLPPNPLATSNLKRRCYYRDTPGGPIKTR